MRIRKMGRAGFGTTATFVLVIIGIALMILLGGDVLSRGSRTNIERAYATGQMLRVGRMALDEAFTSDKGQRALEKAMLAGLRQASSGTTIPGNDATEQRDNLIVEFLHAVRPFRGANPYPSTKDLATDLGLAAPDADTRIEHRFPVGQGTGARPTGMTWRQGDKGWPDTVYFGIDASTNAMVPLETLLNAYKTEIANGKLMIDANGTKNSVEIRPVVFHVLAPPPPQQPKQLARQPPSEFFGKKVGRGLARARVTLHWALLKGPPIVRTVVSDYFFTLSTPAQPAAGAQEGDWKIDFDSVEWQRGTVDDTEKDAQ